MKEKKSIKLKGIKNMEKVEMKDVKGGLCSFGDMATCFKSYHVFGVMPIVGDHLFIMF